MRAKARLAAGLRVGAHQVFESGAKLPGEVQAVFETVGEATWKHSVRSLVPGGTIICSGATSGNQPPAELAQMFFLQKNLVGSTMGTLDELRDLLDSVATTGISPEIGLELPMSDAEQGFRSMLDGETAGKIVFTR